jgi:hypothetical protein
VRALAAAALEAERSQLFRSSIDKLRVEAATDHPRTTGPLVARSWEWMTRELEQFRGLPDEDRPRARRNMSLPAGYGLDHVDRYMRACKAVARRHFYSPVAAPLVHELVRRSGYLVTSVQRGPAWPTGPLASSLSAEQRGASWGAGATSLREQRYQFARQLQSPDYERAYLLAIEEARRETGSA